MISNLCYSFFRAAHLFGKTVSQENIAKAFWLADKRAGALIPEDIALFPKNLNDDKKLVWLNKNQRDLFPFYEEVSNEIDKDLFSMSMLHQPLLYLRSRPNAHDRIISAISAANIKFEVVDTNTIALANNTALAGIRGINRDFVVQDKNSQKVLDYLNQTSVKKDARIWDCCVASGGKSILLADKLKETYTLTISDIRENILANAKVRLAEAEVKVDQVDNIDLENQSDLNYKPFDLIICDAPCTGSGTWSRTPEQLYFFNKKSIEKYSKKQKVIASNAITKLSAGGIFFYITCSVFSAENEDVISFLLNNNNCSLLHQKYHVGAGERADSLFVAVLQSNMKAS